MSGTQRYDTIVIGAGQAGLPLSNRLAAAGRRTLLVERAHLGGTCINVGCTPTKTMVASARAAHVARRAGRLGVRTTGVEVDLAAVVDRKNEVVQSWRQANEQRVADREGLDLVRGHARFVAPGEIVVNEARYAAGTVVVNAGARPAVPPLPGLADVPYLDSTAIMELREVPEHLIVLGGGYIGCEFGQMFRRFGARVTIVNRGPHLMDREDTDVSEALEGVFRDEAIDLRLGVAVEAVRRNGAGVEVELSGGERLRGSHLLVAVGRAPNTDELGCEAAGIALDRRGFITVDDQYRTTAPGVYAVGDVAGGPQFTHSSWDDHRILYEHLFGRNGRSRGGRLVPYCAFTDPQLARVGLSDREARERNVPFEVATMPFGHIARALELDEPAGLLKVLLDPNTERILGAAIVGVEAGELIHIFSTLMQAGGTARAIVDAEAVHPTLAEGVQSVVMRLERYALK